MEIFLYDQGTVVMLSSGQLIYVRHEGRFLKADPIEDMDDEKVGGDTTLSYIEEVTAKGCCEENGWLWE